MDIGYKEQFGLVDLFIFPIWWLRVHWYFEHYLFVIVTLSLFLSGLGFTARRFFAK
jgi:hypothetical protein